MGAWAGVAHILAQSRPKKVQHFRQLVVLEVVCVASCRPLHGGVIGGSFVAPPHRPLLIEHVFPDAFDLSGREAGGIESDTPRLFEFAHAPQIVTLLRAEDLELWSIGILPGRARAVWAKREAHERSIPDAGSSAGGVNFARDYSEGFDSHASRSAVLELQTPVKSTETS